eukprot:TRINITY_DN9501_c0_g1_i1.p1 TRINITY_DN9501_c0_g1~~TRINITY_DN9501_c0_g1_i1.p1  ORF type:complete len:425 (-),score=102.80 TRINITY_DN9501_c0_g1_i1:309-1583(-)
MSSDGEYSSEHGASKSLVGFSSIALAAQVVITGVFYTAEFDTANFLKTTESSVYNYYVGVALMMFVGFGYLMTFLKAYGLGAVGFTFFITCLGVEWAMVVEGLMSKQALTIDFMSLLNANFAVAAVLISFGGLIGKISPVQISVVVLFELVCYCANKIYVLKQVDASPLIADCGGTIIIHVFGAYFGLAACKVLGKPRDATLNASSYVSDLFSLVGTVFLWLFWPSFVAGALPSGEGQSKALINTVLALLSSSVVTFGLTPLLEKSKKLTMVPVQNATLAGGVAIGATANLVDPFGAMVIGGLAGALSTFGFVKQPLFSDVDTCGINNLHGMPGIFGGLVSVAVPYMYKGTPIVATQQALGLVGTLAVASISGAFCGAVLKAMGPPDESFSDETFWDCAEDIAKGGDKVVDDTRFPGSLLAGGM